MKIPHASKYSRGEKRKKHQQPSFDTRYNDYADGSRTEYTRSPTSQDNLSWGTIAATVGLCILASIAIYSKDSDY